MSNYKRYKQEFQDHRNERNVQEETTLNDKKNVALEFVLCYIRETLSVLAGQYCINYK